MLIWLKSSSNHNNMKKALLKLTGVVGIMAASSMFAQAQNRKMGDNLGNHKATKTLDMSSQKIVNALGVAIGTADVTNTSIGLQVEGDNKTILIPRVTNVTLIPTANLVNGMITYDNLTNKFYVYQNNNWVSFSLGFDLNGAVINTTGNANGYTLETSPAGVTTLKLSPATETTPGIVTAEGDQTFGGNKTIAGNFAVGTATTAANTTLTGTLTTTGATTLSSTLNAVGATTLGNTLNVAGLTTLTGNTGTPAAPVSGLVITGAVPSTSPDTESFMVIDNATGQVRVSSSTANAFFKQKVAITGVTLGANEATTIVLTAPNILKNDGVVVNFDADDLAATPELAFLSIINATATAAGSVTVTLADFRQEPESGTALTSATTLLTGKHFTITRYRQVAP
jgi:hypothetical protein